MAEYIERDALLSDIEAAEKHKGMGMVVAQTLKRYVKRAPAADVAPVVHAKVTHISEDSPYCLYGTCKNCGAYIQSWNYCPSCGAKMDLEDNS